jgi:hypothetical protein
MYQDMSEMATKLVQGSPELTAQLEKAKHEMNILLDMINLRFTKKGAPLLFSIMITVDLDSKYKVISYTKQ